jgi:hypothetical protein
VALLAGELENLAAGLTATFPKVHWDWPLIDRIWQSLDAVPECDGPLTRFLRHARGEALEQEETHTVFESHINITSIPERNERSLILLGFEPDDFTIPHPQKYIRHFTLKLKVTQASPRRSLLLNWLSRQTATATDMLYGLDRPIEWYVEQEIYPLRNSRRYDCRRAGRSSWSPTMSLRTNVRYDGIGPSEVAKNADVHVKLCRQCMYNEPGHARAHVVRMEQFLVGLNFYRTVSGAGNSLYTGQFFQRRDARLIFSELNHIAMIAGGVAGITMESCVGFTRSQAVNGHQAAEIGPILGIYGTTH